jgi:hypothetical protein
VTNAGIVAILMVFKSNLGVLIYENRQRPNTKKWHTRILIGAFALTIASCTTEQIQTGVDILNETAKGVNGPPDSSTVAAGLKEALKKGAKSGGETLSKPDGFLKNQAIKILFPPEFKSAESKLRQLGMGKLADQAITSFNRSAEKASQKAYPILASAITQMTIADAMNILLGPKDAATKLPQENDHHSTSGRILSGGKRECRQGARHKVLGHSGHYVQSDPFCKACAR